MALIRILYTVMGVSICSIAGGIIIGVACTDRALWASRANLNQSQCGPGIQILPIFEDLLCFIFISPLTSAKLIILGRFFSAYGLG